ncbi:MAG TPA: hypothetical protein VG297_21930 [Bryobacteraceae bacterium]|nr:hypothetical protein [Bryobacteraceae bacterium]
MRSYLTSSILAAAVAVVSLAPLASAQQGPGAPAAEGAARGGRGGGRGRGGPPRPPAGPTPHLPNDPYLGANAGKPDLGGNSQGIDSKMRGIWNVPYIVDMQRQGCAEEDAACIASAGRTHSPDHPIVVPFNDKGKKVFDEATATNSKDDPEGFCLPPGVPRMMYTPYPTEIFQLPERVVFVYEGGAHVWREIWMDGRQQPKDPNPTYLGYSTGKWDGDTLVVDTIGMNDRTWLDAAGHPHGEKLHVTEKFTRTDSNTLKVEATIDDPDYYTKPWTVVTFATWSPNNEILEYICQENNRDLRHLVGK